MNTDLIVNYVYLTLYLMMYSGVYIDLSTVDMFLSLDCSSFVAH